MGLALLSTPLLALLVTPVHLTAFDSEAAHSIIDSEPTNLGVTQSDDLLFSITSLSRGNVSFLGPRTPSGWLVSPRSVESPQDWIATSIGGVITERGNVIDYSINSRMVEIVLESSSTPSVFVVRTADASRTITVPPNEPGRTIYVSSGRSIENSTRILLFGSPTVNVSTTDTVHANLGPVDITTSIRVNEGRATISRFDLVKAFYLVTFRSSIIGVALLLLVAFSYLLGRSLINLGGFRTPETSIAIMLGLSLSALLLGSLNYLVPGRSATIILFGATAMTVVVTLFHSGIRAFRIGPRQRIPKLPIVAGLIFYVHPTVSTRATNAGFLQTDTYDYFHLQRVFWSDSITSAGTDWGWGLRTLDSSLRSAVENVFNITSWEAATVVRFLVASMAIVAIHSAAKALGASNRFASALSTFGCVMVPLHGLWFEGYLTREIFAHLVLIGLGFGVVIVKRISNIGFAGQRELILIGIVMAPALALVPPYLVLAPALVWGLVLGMRSLMPKLVIVKSVCAFLAGLIPLSVINLWWMLGSDVSSNYARAVEGVGKNIVVPFHATARFPSALLGLTSFHLNDSALFGGSPPAWIPSALASLQDAMDHIAGNWSVVVVVLAAIFYLVASQLRIGTMERGFLASYLLLTVAFTVLLISAWDNQSFFVLMWFWTLAPSVIITVFLLSIGHARTFYSGAKVLLVLLLLFNTTSTLFAATRWMDSPYSESASRTHYDLASDVLFMQDVAPGLEGDVEIIVRVSELTGTDDDRVLINFVELVLTSAGHECSNCVYDSRNGSVQYTNDVEPTETNVLVIGGLGCPGDYQLTDRSRSLLLCRRA